jgi:hypothetical protein
MNDPKQQRVEITREMKEMRLAMEAKIGAPEMCPHMRLKDECGFCAADEHRAKDATDNVGAERQIRAEGTP